ncbi:MAG: YebC/PmpR family DNA-binding transcriptional regulator, partial [Paraglaciecola sp.]
APHTEYNNTRKALMDNDPELKFEAEEITFIPQTESAVSGDDVANFDKFMDMLEDCDDVQHVYHNAVVER